MTTTTTEKMILTEKSKKTETDKIIPIFFATDDNYVPCMSVALYSMMKNASKDYKYKVIIINCGLKEENITKLQSMQQENFEISFANVESKINAIKEKLTSQLRDYYSNSIYYRIFIPSMFKEYDKALYLDGDIAVLGDISKLYNYELGDNLVGAVPDQIVNGNKIFEKYAKKALNLEPIKYFNSGILIMNLKEFRKEKIEDKFVHLLQKYNFKTIAPDQDYLNVLCKNKVLYLYRTWNKASKDDKAFKGVEPELIHYLMFKKPWLYSNVTYEEYFWPFAKETPFYEDLKIDRKNYGLRYKIRDYFALKKLMKNSKRIYNSENTFSNVVTENYFIKNKI